MGKYVVCPRLVARPGQRDALLETVLACATMASSVPGTELWAINKSATDPDAIQLYEIFDNQETHDVVLPGLPGYAELVDRGLSLMAGTPGREQINRNELILVGGYSRRQLL
jgi:hypothetical protein